MTIYRFLGTSECGISALFGTLSIWSPKCFVTLHTFKQKCWWEAGMFYSCFVMEYLWWQARWLKVFCLKKTPAPFNTAIWNLKNKKRSSAYHKKDSIIKQNLWLWIVLWFCSWEQTVFLKIPIALLQHYEKTSFNLGFHSGVTFILAVLTTKNNVLCQLGNPCCYNQFYWMYGMLDFFMTAISI